MEQLVVDLLRANDVSTPLPISVEEGFTEVVTFLKAGDRVHALMAAEALLLAEPVLLNTAGVTGATVGLSVPTAVPAGSTVFVDVVFRNQVDPPTVTDAAGNTYAQDFFLADGDARVIHFRASVTEALAPGDEITLSGFTDPPDGTGAAVAYFVAAELGAKEGQADDFFTAATSASSGPLVVGTVPMLLVGLLQTQNSLADPHMPEFDQFALHSNGGAGNRSVLTAKRVMSVAGSYEWAITLNAPRSGTIALMSYPIVAP